MDKIKAVIPGLALCLGVTGAAYAAARGEASAGRVALEPLVLAILIGVAVRTAWTPPARVAPGVGFAAHTLLECAIVLLGASVSVRAVLAAGPWLMAGIAGVVALALAAGFGVGRAFGLPPKLAVLVACGNAICGNSAIAAVAPVIGAEARDVTASIAFTAVLGVGVVLGLPPLGAALGLSGYGSGVLSGLTVYAVPQVLAAAAPAGVLAVQVGTMVKLVRVLMLGPVVFGLSLAFGGSGSAVRAAGGRRALVPWFIVGFLALAGLRAAGLVPEGAAATTGAVAGVLTVVAMAALGLGVDMRVLGRAGPRVVGAATGSLLALGGLSLGLIRLLGMG